MDGGGKRGRGTYDQVTITVMLLIMHIYEGVSTQLVVRGYRDYLGKLAYRVLMF